MANHARRPSRRVLVGAHQSPELRQPIRKVVEIAKPGPDATGSLDQDQSGLAPGEPSADNRRAVLPADMSRFLVDLSIALHRIAIYPRDHPSLVPVLDTLARRAEVLLHDRPRFAVGVARDRLVIEGVVSEARHPLLRGLAEHLHRHHVAAISFLRGVGGPELTDVVAALAENPNHGQGPVGRLPKEQAPSWPHVTLHPLTIDGLEIVDGSAETSTGASARCADLWVGLARAAMERSAGDNPTTFAGEPAAVARAINEHQRVEAYDQVIVGYLLEIAEELREAGGVYGAELRRRVSSLVSTMHPETLRRLLDMGGDALGRQQFLQDAAVGMAADAVVTLVKSAAEAAEQTVSTGFVRLLTKLAAHAEHGSPAVRPLADSALRLQVDRLIAGWSLPDPTPSDYTGVLDGIARGWLPGGRPRASAGGTPAEPLRMVQMSLEIDEETPALWRAVDLLADEGRLVHLLDVLEQAGADDLAQRVWAHVASPETVRRLLCARAAGPCFVGLPPAPPARRGPVAAFRSADVGRPSGAPRDLRSSPAPGKARVRQRSSRAWATIGGTCPGTCWRCSRRWSIRPRTSIRRHG